MIKVIGKTECGKCNVIKCKLEEKGIDFKYILLDKLDAKTRVKYISMARKANKLDLPIIIKDNQLIDLDTVLG